MALQTNSGGGTSRIGEINGSPGGGGGTSGIGGINGSPGIGGETFSADVPGVKKPGTAILVATNIGPTRGFLEEFRLLDDPVAGTRLSSFFLPDRNG